MPIGVYERTPEHREAIRQAALKRWADPEYREKQRRAALRPESRARARRNALGNKHSLGHKHSAKTREKIRQVLARPEVREKIRQARLRQVFPKNMTSIERLLRDEFRKRRLKFEMHRTMFCRFQPDFVFQQARLIVQADGDYWHSRPDHIARDKALNSAAYAGGWSVWRFGEREIHMHPAACARAVARFVRDH